MLEIDLVRVKSSLKVSFAYSLAAEVFHAMSLVLLSPKQEGLDQWAYATHAALPPDLKTSMENTLGLLKGITCSCFWLEAYHSAHPVHRQFSALIAELNALPEEKIEESIQETLTALAQEYQDDHEVEIEAPSLADVDALRSFLQQVAYEEERIDDTVALIQNPVDLKSRLIAVVARFWEQFCRQQYERVLPLMERSITHHQRQNHGADFATVFSAVTGRLVPDQIAERAEGVEEVVFVPSAHIGPYVTLNRLSEDQPLYIHYNCRPTGGPERQAAPTTLDLFPPLKAMADETRLQILSILDGQELYAQEIVDQLDISQSAVSRHLRLMVAGGVLNARKENSMKFFSINEETLASLANKLRAFRTKPRSEDQG